MDPDAVGASVAVAVVDEGAVHLRYGRFLHVDFAPDDAAVLGARRRERHVGVHDFAEALHVEYRVSGIEHDFLDDVAHGVAGHEERVGHGNLDADAAVHGGPVFGVHDIHLVGPARPHLFLEVQVDGQRVARYVTAGIVAEGLPVFAVAQGVAFFGFDVQNAVTGVDDGCVGEVRQFVRVDGEVDVLVVGGVGLERDAHKVGSRRQRLRLGDVFGLDSELRVVVADGDALVIEGVKHVERDALGV